MTVTENLTFDQIKTWFSSYFSLDEVRTLNDRAALLRAVSDLSADLSMVRSALEESLRDDMEEDEVETPYGKLVRHYRPISPKWDGRRLAFVVAQKVPLANEDGEPLAPSELVEKTTETLIETGALDNSSHSWRRGKLKALGIDPKSFLETDGYKVSVRFE